MGAQTGLLLCAQVIIPSLLPFFVAAALLSRLGFATLLGALTARPMARLFGVSGAGAAAFVLGISGGYPLGAATVADLFRQKRIGKEEAERLLAFCDNSGPAFIVGAAGVGVFHSAATGLALYAVHILAAAAVGFFLSFPRMGPTSIGPRTGHRIEFHAASLPDAFAESVRSSATSLLSICGFVVFFSALMPVLDALQLFGTLAGALSLRTGLELRWTRALLQGFWELGNGIGGLAGLTASPLNLALASGILGWGGLSVHCQALGVLGGTGLSARRHELGKALHAVLSAALAYLAAVLLL